MKQLLLTLDPARPQTLESFVVGQHAELLALLHRFAARQASSFGVRSLYIWGTTGVGKSHLLHALDSVPSVRVLTPATPLEDFEFSPFITLTLVDDCHLLDATQQGEVFNLYNQIKEHEQFFVACGNLPPAQLQVREDLRTRLGWGLIYQLHGLSDQEKIAALEHAAEARGITLPAGVLAYLITHVQRDMPTLTSILQAVINLSLEIKRPITLPFLREVIQQTRSEHG